MAGAFGLVSAVSAAARALRGPSGGGAVAAEERAVDPDDGLHTVFVAVVAQHGEEVQCAHMLKTLFENAAVPGRITAAVVHYVDPDALSEDGVGMAAFFSDIRGQYERVVAGGRSRASQIRVIKRHAHEAKGLEPARHLLLNGAYRGERYWCEAFPKLRFVKGWDDTAISLSRPKQVLTVVPPDRFNALRPTFPVAAAGSLDTDEHRFPRVEGRFFTVNTPGRPMPCPLLCPQFVFAPATMVTAVPPDPRLRFCDHVEPLLRSAKLVTRGWTLFAPAVPLVFRHRVSPVDGDDDGDVIGSVTAATPEDRRMRNRGVMAALSMLKADPCRVCGRPRDEHTTAATLNHPFDPHQGALADRSGVFGTVRTLKEFRRGCGAWVGVAPTNYAKAGLVRRGNIPTDELSVKGLYDAVGGSTDYA